MKTSISHPPTPPPAFKPVTVALTFETQAELDAVGRLFNTGAVETVLKEVGGSGMVGLYQVFDKAGSHLNQGMFGELRSIILRK